MSKPSRRPTREARKQHKQKRRAAQRALRAHRARAGRLPPRAASVSNRLCPYSTEAEEQAARKEAVAGQLGVFRTLLPKLLKELSKIPDPRQPKKVKHKLTVAAPTHVLYCNLLINIAARQELVRQNISSFYNSLKI